MTLKEFTIEVSPGMLRDGLREWLLWAIERYGYARREGEHQGHRSADWYRAIDRVLTIFEFKTLEAMEGQAGRLYKRMAELERLIANYSAGAK